MLNYMWVKSGLRVVGWFGDYVRVMYGLCLGYLLGHVRSYLGYVWVMFGLCVGLCLGIVGLYLDYVGSCLGYV